MQSTESTKFKERFNKMLHNFAASYDHVVCYHLNEDKQIMLSDGDTPQKCRFCEKENPDVTFKKLHMQFLTWLEIEFLNPIMNVTSVIRCFLFMKQSTLHI